MLMLNWSLIITKLFKITFYICGYFETIAYTYNSFNCLFKWYALISSRETTSSKVLLYTKLRFFLLKMLILSIRVWHHMENVLIRIYMNNCIRSYSSGSEQFFSSVFPEVKTEMIMESAHSILHLNYYYIRL